MTATGFVLMVLSLCFVVALAGWCYYRVLTAPAPPPDEVEHFHSA